MEYLFESLLSSLKSLNDLEKITNHLATHAHNENLRKDCQKVLLLINEFNQQLPDSFKITAPSLDVALSYEHVA